ncbi:isocitrate dehydrogenase [NAD] subunit gamma, mitochondrial [Hydra vulgaris]|uniref:Isocitrate dehydrogenase [NAD] subunit, mitochondrial n=1 Tax=Hydra vulgaris TaxID=6087 RepID=A0ABM4BLU0_HYDVU
MAAFYYSSRTLCRPSILNLFSKYNLSIKHVSYYNSNIPDATYGGRHTVSLIPADGIGQSLIMGIVEVFQNSGVPVDFEECYITGDTNEEKMKSFNDIKTSVLRNGTALKGNWATSMGIDSKSYNVLLRHDLDLYANVVKFKSYPTVITRHSNVDLIVVRENTEGEYTNLEHENIPGVIEMIKIITKKKSERIAKYAFNYAMENNRKKVTAVHKANIMKLSDGLFLKVCKEVAESYPEIDFNDIIIDNCAMQMVSKPEQFDVIVTPNLYGNVLSNIAAALVGGPGLPHGENHGNGIHVFESGTRNSGMDIATKNIANPMSMLFAATALLRHLQLSKHAQLIESCIHKIVTTNQARTVDIGGNTSTSEFFEILVKEVEAYRYKRKVQMKKS